MRAGGCSSHVCVCVFLECGQPCVCVRTGACLGRHTGAEGCELSYVGMLASARWLPAILSFPLPFSFVQRAHVSSTRGA